MLALGQEQEGALPEKHTDPSYTGTQVGLVQKPTSLTHIYMETRHT